MTLFFHEVKLQKFFILISSSLNFHQIALLNTPFLKDTVAVNFLIAVMNEIASRGLVATLERVRTN